MENWRVRMSETAFPINDLLRRKLQTGLTIASLTTCVAATLFLLFFSDQVGFGISSVAKDTLTLGTSNVFSQFLLFIGGLIFAIGAIIVSFIVFLMMAQRTKDFGLMKATGCPNSLVFGYFFTELLGVTFVGCISGVVLGLVSDYAIINMNVFQTYNKAPNYWFIPLVFGAFFAFALIFGAKPIFDAARMSPIKAISSTQYFGLGKTSQFKPLSKKGLIIRIASRSLFRRKTATVRIVVFLSAVFMLLTVSIAGSIIANDTSTSWIKKAIGENVILVADNEMANQYVQLLQTYSGAKANIDFNYSEIKFAISNDVIQKLNQTQGIAALCSRLVWRGTIEEINGYMFDPDTISTLPIGDSRQGTSLIVGIDTKSIISEPFTTGQFLNSTSNLEAIVGDTVALVMYKSYDIPLGNRKQTIIGDPLREGIRIQNTTFSITGICLDPINNGIVTYVSLNVLEEITGISNPNIILISVDSSANYANTLSQVQEVLATVDSDLIAIDLNQVLYENVNFLGSLWSVIMLLPIFALVAAAICLINYLMIAIDEQRQEFGILRATGGKPRTIMSILAVQSFTVLISSFAVGTSIGTIITILILTTEPVVSAFTILIISSLLLVALSGIFLISLYPAIKFSKKSMVEIMS
jgi:ABC-type antimicrobial peptide transport system permease subunit